LGQPLYLNTFESSTPRHVSYLLSLVEIGLVVLEKKWFKGEKMMPERPTTEG